MSYICSMESTFTYYKHLNALDRILVSHKFIDGETYVIKNLGLVNILSGKFLVNMCVLTETRGWVYSDIIREQGIAIEDRDVKKIMSIAKSLKFKQITK